MWLSAGPVILLNDKGVADIDRTIKKEGALVMPPLL
jgi:hypothetical protein